MTSKKSYIINTLIIVIITFISLYFTVGHEIKNVFSTLMRADIKWIFMLICIMLTYYLLDGLVTKVFASHYKKDYTFKQGVVNGLIGTLFSDLTPSSSGGQFAQVYMFNKQGIAPSVASGILLMCFISYQIVMILLTATIMLLQLPYFMHEGLNVTVMALVGFAINFIVTLALLLGAKSPKFQNFLIKHVVYFLSKIRIIKDYEATKYKIEDYFTKFRNELNILFKNRPLLYKACIINLFKLIIMYSTPFFACQALHIPVDITQYLNFLSLAAIINLINTFLPIPGASGGSEGAYMVLFGFLGHINATASMMLWRFFSFYFGLILSFLTFIFSREMKQPKK